MTQATVTGAGSVAVVTLGCGRNEVDSDQVAGALGAAGFPLVADPDDADLVLVNTCTFIAPARQESIEVVLDACDTDRPVLVIGCMAERYGQELRAALPEVAGVLSFADYPRLPQIVAAVLAGQPVPAPPVAESGHGLPLLVGDAAPAGASVGSTSPTAGARPAARAPARPAAPPTASFPVRTVPHGPWAYLKLAGGCDRVCTFCAIPSFRGRFASRPLSEVVAEARWLVGSGVRELVCVSENTTSWGKDLPSGRRGQVDLIRAFEGIEGLERVRLLYLQPAEIIPELLDAMADSPVVAGYYDLSLQHASPPVLARMARSGGAERFLRLLADIRARDPRAVFRSSFITGFPGETEADVDIVEQFLIDARLDWTGFFPFSVEDATPSATMPDQVDAAVARARRDRLTQVAEAAAADAADGFVGRTLSVLVESVSGSQAVGRSYREAPDTDGEVRITGCDLPVGQLATVQVVAADGVDLLAEPVAAGVGKA
ncbi:30S ribosomal protein S12 methylthiotransferase RimO [soil metagenome]